MTLTETGKYIGYTEYSSTEPTLYFERGRLTQGHDYDNTGWHPIPKGWVKIRMNAKAENGEEVLFEISYGKYTKRIEDRHVSRAKLVGPDSKYDKEYAEERLKNAKIAPNHIESRSPASAEEEQDCVLYILKRMPDYQSKTKIRNITDKVRNELEYIVNSHSEGTAILLVPGGKEAKKLITALLHQPSDESGPTPPKKPKV